MVADARVQADAVNDVTGVQAAHLGVGVQLVKIGHTQGQVGVGKQLDGLGLGQAREDGIHILLDGPLLQKPRKGMGTGGQFPVPRRAAYHDAAGVEVIVQRMALPQKLRAEKDMQVVEFFPYRRGIPDGHRGFDDDGRLRRILPG